MVTLFGMWTAILSIHLRLWDPNRQGLKSALRLAHSYPMGHWVTQPRSPGTGIIPAGSISEPQMPTSLATPATPAC